jgi:hypothetical protein
MMRNGRRLGYAPGELPDEMRIPLAGLSLSLALGPDQAPDPRSLVEFIDAALSYSFAAPWQHWDDETAVSVTVTRQGTATHFEATILGAAGLTHGLMISRGKRSAQRVAMLQDGGWAEEALHIPMLSMTLSPEPRWAAETMKRVTGIPFLPLPIRTGGGTTSVPSSEELMDLTAALKAVSRLTPTAAVVEDELTLSEMTVRVRAGVAPAPGSAS